MWRCGFFFFIGKALCLHETRVTILTKHRVEVYCKFFQQSNNQLSYLLVDFWSILLDHGRHFLRHVKHDYCCLICTVTNSLHEWRASLSISCRQQLQQMRLEKCMVAQKLQYGQCIVSPFFLLKLNSRDIVRSKLDWRLWGWWLLLLGWRLLQRRLRYSLLLLLLLQRARTWCTRTRILTRQTRWSFWFWWPWKSSGNKTWNHKFKALTTCRTQWWTCTSAFPHIFGNFTRWLHYCQHFIIYKYSHNIPSSRTLTCCLAGCMRVEWQK